MRVLVVGGGIGGLACAQGLLRRGLDVTVVEQDSDLALTGGYKLHLGVPVVTALRDLLSPSSFETLLGSSVATRGFTLAVRDARGCKLVGASEPTPGLSLDVDRIALRLILALRLEERMLLGRRCCDWRVEGETVVALLDDGLEIEADLLVIADGAGSKLAEKLAGRPTSSFCGIIGVAGRTPWERLPQATKSLLRDEPMLAIGPGGTGVFASAHDPAGHAAVRTLRTVGAPPSPVAIWGLIAVEGALAYDRVAADESAVVDAAVALLRRHHWAEEIVELLTRSQRGSVSAFRFNAADPDDLAPWRSSRITALGDAVHAMPPTGGQGAATAIMDAHHLAERIHAAARGEVTPVVAVLDYETDLRTRAAPAVRESLQPVAWIRAGGGRGGNLMYRAAVPALAAGAAVLRSVARRRRR
ncbi:MAG: FAD-dependent oxidoreductase [Arachnia sp.]